MQNHLPNRIWNGDWEGRESWTGEDARASSGTTRLEEMNVQKIVLGPDGGFPNVLRSLRTAARVVKRLTVCAYEVTMPRTVNPLSL